MSTLINTQSDSTANQGALLRTCNMCFILSTVNSHLGKCLKCSHKLVFKLNFSNLKYPFNLAKPEKLFTVKLHWKKHSKPLYLLISVKQMKYYNFLANLFLA